MGELKRKTLEIRKEPITQKTLGGRVRVEWYSIVAVTPLRQLPLLMHQNVSAALQLGCLWLGGNDTANASRWWKCVCILGMPHDYLV